MAREEWEAIATALGGLPAAVADAARRRIRESAGAARPVVCPLLDIETGACLVYDARPVACRAYGFYAERESVLGCGRIESIGTHKDLVAKSGVYRNLYQHQFRTPGEEPAEGGE